MAIVEGIKKQNKVVKHKTYSQPMLHGFFSIKPKKDAIVKGKTPQAIVKNCNAHDEVNATAASAASASSTNDNALNTSA